MTWSCERAGPAVIAVAQLPPPVIGFALASQQLIEGWRSRHPMRVLDTTGIRGATGLRKHAGRQAATWRAGRAIARQPGGVCYLACEGGLGLAYTLQLVVAARRAGLPTYLHHHSFAYLDRPRPLMHAILAAGPDIHHILLCETMRDAFARSYGRPVTASVLSNAAFVPPAPPAPPPAGPLTLGHLSNLNRDKGLHTFLDLLRQALAVGMDVRGILAGPAALAADRQAIAAARRELGDRLDYRDAVYDEDKARFYREIDLFVFPTRYANEAQPVVLFEALAAGAQVLSHDRGGITAQVAGDGLIVARDADFVAPALAWIAAHGLASRADRGAVAARHADRYLSARRQAVRLFERMA
jgi:glycosyltransferase involved in cell wall biosynthesis